MNRMLRLLSALCALSVFAPAATLEYLSLDQMIEKSTSVVRGKVLATRCSFRGPTIYTFWRIQVSERLKGQSGASQLEVATPGGSLQGYVQSISGSPVLAPGSEYVFFIWTGKSGLNQIIGLSQGLFRLEKDAKGNAVATRSATSETMLNAQTGREMADQAMRIDLNELRRRIHQQTGGGE